MRNLLIAAFVLSTSAFATGCAVDADATSDTDDAASAPGSFDLWQADDGQWHFHLVAGNGNTLLTSEAYTDRTGAINGILSVEANGMDVAQYQVVAAAHGYLLHLVAGNGEVISSTEVYSNKSNATRAITSCVNSVTSYNTKIRNKTTGARVAVVLGDSGQWHFNVFAKNGQVVLSSESYTSQAAAYNGAMAVQDAGVASFAYDLKATVSGSGYYFNIKAANGEIVGTSQQYSTQEAAQAGRTALIALLPSIDII
jgi:uncharacterized protein YegP (UPF0339 family)